MLAFRQARSEHEKVTLRAFGLDLEVPPLPPLGFVLLSDESADDPEGGDLRALLDAAIGRYARLKIETAGAQDGHLALALGMVAQSWREADDPGEAPAPVVGAGSAI